LIKCKNFREINKLQTTVSYFDAERSAQSSVQVVAPNGGESLYLGALDTISWSSMGLVGPLKLELLVNGEVAGTIAENLPATQTSCQWQVGKTLTGTVNPGADYKVRISSLEPPPASGTTYYFYDSGGKLLAEYDGTGTCVKDYLYLGGKMIGEYVPTTSSYYYYASDQINSTRMVTDAAGAVVHSAQYDPYGGLYKTWIDTYHPKPGFSGKEREFGSEMDYFGARYYGHGQYRFISVDPVINKDEALVNPQLWNLYFYCHNNPITFFDPNGDIEISILLGFRNAEMGPRYGAMNQTQRDNLNNLALQNGHTITFGPLSQQSLDKALGIKGGWTLVITHGSPSDSSTSIIPMDILLSNRERVPALFVTKNKYVGIFTCSSSEFADYIFGGDAAFTVDSGGSGRSNVYGLWLGAIGVADALLRGSNTDKAAENGSRQMQLIEKDKEDGDHINDSNR
jgi:RHS repeat-associated protein